jgi:outer membrane protein OmpA-like peptidoglycan-associated protein/tetratricopeptide (TPR) repeat protein
MKSLFFLIFCYILGIFALQAQDHHYYEMSASIHKADKHFQRLAYSSAANMYEDLLKKDTIATDRVNLHLKLGKCYRLMNKPQDAEKWYAKAIKNDTIPSVYKLHYAQVLSAQGKYDEAKVWYNKYQSEINNDGRPVNQLEALNKLNRFYKDSAYIKVSVMDLNTEHADFSPAFYGNKVIFVSNRTDAPFLPKNKFKWNNTHFLDLYVTKLEGERVKNSPKLFHQKLNTKYHEGPLVFFDNGKKAFFTRNNYHDGKYKESSEGINKLQMYIAENIGAEGMPEKVVAFAYNNDEYSTGHPAISEDGKTLYFISDVAGGIGGTDLYMSKLVDNQWQKPINMGKPYNTEGNEMFPFIAKGNVLYFASNGHGGLGGLDMFKTDLNDSEKRIINIGYPANTPADDFGMIIDETGKAGYFSSNRPNGKGDDDIYRYLNNKPDKLILNGIVKNKLTDEVIGRANITLREKKTNKEVEILRNEDNGTFIFKLDWDKEYEIVAMKDDYTDDRIEISTLDLSKPQIDGIVLKLAPNKLIAKGTVFNKLDKSIISGANLFLVDEKTNEKTQITTAESGKYEFTPPTNASSFAVKIEKHGYFTGTGTIKLGEKKTGEVVTDFEIEKIEIGKAMKLENIYYDLGKYNIRKDAAIELDKIVDLMKANPEIVIELGSHTDARGSNQSNLTLSQNRAKAAANYVISKGIDKARISGKGYGETVLINDCKDGVNCNEEKHQQNRRTEFKVTGFVEKK